MEKYLITIGRTSGSGGRRVGIALAEKLGIVCYDEELIKEVAKKSGFSEEIIQSYEEKPVKSFLYSLYSGTIAGHGGQVNLPIEQKVFLAQYNTIKELAERESGIFVGRCAEYALEHEKNVIKIFITADEKDCVAHVEETYGFTKKKAEEFIKKTNRDRSNSYSYYTNKEWGNSSNYDITINRSALGLDESVEILADFVERRLRIMEKKEG